MSYWKVLPTFIPEKSVVSTTPTYAETSNSVPVQHTSSNEKLTNVKSGDSYQVTPDHTYVTIESTPPPIKHIPVPVEKEYPPCPINVVNLTNKHVLQLFTQSKFFYNEGSLRILHHWICQLLKLDKSEVNPNSLLNKVKSVYLKCRRLRCSRKVLALNNFETESFNLPRKKSEIISRENAEIAQLKGMVNHLTFVNSSIRQQLHVGSLEKSRLRQCIKRKNDTITRLKKEISNMLSTVGGKKSFLAALGKQKCKSTFSQTDNVLTGLKKFSRTRESQCNLIQPQLQTSEQHSSHLIHNTEPTVQTCVQPYKASLKQPVVSKQQSTIGQPPKTHLESRDAKPITVQRPTIRLQPPTANTLPSESIRQSLKHKLSEQSALKITHSNSKPVGDLKNKQPRQLNCELPRKVQKLQNPQKADFQNLPVKVQLGQESDVTVNLEPSKEPVQLEQIKLQDHSSQVMPPQFNVLPVSVQSGKVFLHLTDLQNLQGKVPKPPVRILPKPALPKTVQPEQPESVYLQSTSQPVQQAPQLNNGIKSSDTNQLNSEHPSVQTNTTQFSSGVKSSQSVVTNSVVQSQINTPQLSETKSTHKGRPQSILGALLRKFDKPEVKSDAQQLQDDDNNQAVRVIVKPQNKEIHYWQGQTLLRIENME